MFIKGRRISTLHPNRLSPQSLKAARSLGLNGETHRQGREGWKHILSQARHGCMTEERTRGVSDELLKSDSSFLIRTYQANSLPRRPDHPKGVPPETARMGAAGHAIDDLAGTIPWNFGPHFWATTLGEKPGQTGGISISNRCRL